MSLFMIGANKKIKETNKLMLLAKLLDWERCRKYLNNIIFRPFIRSLSNCHPGNVVYIQPINEATADK